MTLILLLIALALALALYGACSTPREAVEDSRTLSPGDVLELHDSHGVTSVRLLIAGNDSVALTAWAAQRVVIPHARLDSLKAAGTQMWRVLG